MFVTFLQSEIGERVPTLELISKHVSELAVFMKELSDSDRLAESNHHKTKSSIQKKSKGLGRLLTLTPINENEEYNI